MQLPHTPESICWWNPRSPQICAAGRMIFLSQQPQTMTASTRCLTDANDCPRLWCEWPRCHRLPCASGPLAIRGGRLDEYWTAAVAVAVVAAAADFLSLAHLAWKLPSDANAACSAIPTLAPLQTPTSRWPPAAAPRCPPQVLQRLLLRARTCMVLTPASDENPVIVTTTKVMNQKSPYLPLLYTVGIGNSILSSMRPAKRVTQPLQQRLR